ncbi:Similar to Transposon TX1 uncharacterized 82 kDa protein (Xenopus laevis) [Cotesia congregata]|uniref:Similar to Transposon TX1 uncharacterized 82 kDa protein (Xenopus laevis) n=1 Tax=Cotesia congregata TaxID=51543 RepID=A0A8J2HNR5_COTCN|nr:Similar to Transposon TX1 uncharacterized 82 kDa protein (Xenopus laevis) [Cotesia congregata]
MCSSRDVTGRHEEGKISYEPQNLSIDRHFDLSPGVNYHASSDVIEQEFTKLGIKLSSEITFLKVGIQNPPFNHILSFRRQVYITPQDEEKFPETIKIIFEETTYFIYLSTDSISCFICKKEGHLAKNCPTENLTMHQQTEPLQTQAQETEEIKKDSKKELMTKTTESNKPLLSQTQNPIDNLNTQMTSQEFQIPITPLLTEMKRPRSLPSKTSNCTSTQRLKLPRGDDSSTDYDSSDNDIPEKSQNKTKPKKIKAQDKILAEDWVNITRIIAQKKDYPLTALQLNDFYTKLHCNKYPIELTLQYTTDLLGLKKMMNDVYPYLSSSLKNRTTRITNIFEEHLVAEEQNKARSMDTDLTQ